MKFYSPDFEDFQTMPALFTADGENLNPSFFIDDVPKNTKSLALICHDPDATNGSVWTHWIVSNIPPNTKKIEAGNLIEGANYGPNSFGSSGYGGPDPSPGSGKHRYIFSLYALGTNIDTPDSIARDELIIKMAPNINAQSVWTGIYERA